MINLPIGHGLVGTAIYKCKAVIITEDEDGQMFVFDNDSPEIASEQAQEDGNKEAERILSDLITHDIRKMSAHEVVMYFCSMRESVVRHDTGFEYAGCKYGLITAKYIIDNDPPELAGSEHANSLINNLFSKLPNRPSR